MSFTRRTFLAASSALTASAFQTGAPAGQPDAYATPKPDLPGPFEPTWESLRDNYRLPSWFHQAKFGIFIHWGLYSIPARINEWYERHMYTTDAEWHTQHYGPPDKFGYKDFIPLFTTPNYRPDEWAQLFQRSGAKYVVPVAEHHDGFAMWDSDLTPWCAGKMGPKRDLTGELAKAVRKQNLLFGLSNHRMEHHNFAYPAKGVPNDEFDPKYAGFYGPPIPGEFNSSDASAVFQGDWLARVQEQVDKYEPAMVYFDNGVNPREYDDVKLRAAAYYYNRAAERHQEVTLATKDVAYLFGSVQDFEKQQRAPKWIYAGGWQCDDAIGSTWGYTTGMTVRSPQSVIRELIELASMGGNLLLNISPMGDGSIPEVQQKVLLGIGEWLQQHGEGIYGAKPWLKMGEGPSIPADSPGDWKGGSTAARGPKLKPRTPIRITESDFRFTTANSALFAFGYLYPQSAARPQALLKSFALTQARVEKVTLLGKSARPIPFTQTVDALVCELTPFTDNSQLPYCLKIEGYYQL